MSKKILITGKNSYIGAQVAEYLKGRCQVECVSLRERGPEELSFSGYDAVFHVAGIAHADTGRVSEETKRRYYEVNCELAEKTARKALQDGVRQFIYMSSVIVFGESAPAGKEKRITGATQPSPANFYGDSKLQAENRLRQLETKEFCVAIVRSPMVYGRGGKGNFRMLEKIAGTLPVFPALTNRRSMIYIENLTEFISRLIELEKGGIFYPQNAEYVSTAQMVQTIAKAKGRRIRLLKFLDPVVLLASHLPGRIGRMTDKAFGSLIIDQSLSRAEIDGYQKYDLEESIGRIYEI